MPGAVRSITLQEASRLYETLPLSRGALILHQQSVFEFSDVILGQEGALFSKMTRRERTSKSNSLCAMSGFAPKVGWTQM